MARLRKSKQQAEQGAAAAAPVVEEGGAAEASPAAPAPAPRNSEAAALAARSAESLRDPDALILPLGAIVIPRDLLRDLDRDHAEELAGEMAENGQLQPIVVDPMGDGRYKLVAGLHRYTGKTILAEREPMNMANHQIRATLKGSAHDLVIGYMENVKRKAFTPSEEAAALVRLQEHFQCNQQELAQRVQKSPGYVSKYLALHDADIEIKEAIDANELALSRWYNNRGKSLAELLGAPEPAAVQPAAGIGDPLAADAEESAEQLSAEEEGQEPAAPKAAPKKKKKGAKPEQRLALPLSAGERLARLLATLAERYNLPGIELKSRATKADILAVLTTRLDDIAEAVEGDEGG
jgi:ParB/RepB/Spo0J family partition protein